jgi:hypothetical protein
MEMNRVKTELVKLMWGIFELEQHLMSIATQVRGVLSLESEG